MNDALRLLAKLLRRYGYDIKRHYEYNLLPVANLSKINQLSPLYATGQQNAAPGTDSSFDKLFICLRTCLRNHNEKRKPLNVAGVDRYELVSRCMRSVIRSINYAVEKKTGGTINLVVFDDHSDERFIKSFEDICRNSKCRWEIRTTHEYGQGESLLEQFEFARGSNGLFYFCEDDYLHEVSAVAEMVVFYEQIFRTCRTHLVIHPQEHEFLYSRTIYPSYLLLGENRHWRTISHATHVLFTHSKIVSDHWQYFENTRFVGDKKKRRLGSEAKTTDLLFNHIPGFAPIPSLAAHMQTESCLPPFFNWRPLWDRNGPD